MKMRILILGDGNSVHTIKWVTALSNKGIHIGLFSLADINHNRFKDLDNFQFNSLDLDQGIFRTGEGSLKKIAYLKALPQLRAFIKVYQPDILHAHYASSYGFLGQLSHFHPFIVSVWGSDIYDFPRKNLLFKSMIKSTLSKADRLLSTSKVMARETRLYTNKEVIITPFGVDINKFKKIIPKIKTQKIIIGTVKALEPKYGIDTLLDAFAILCEKHTDTNIHLEIIGEGSSENDLKKKVTDLKLESKVHFLGRVDNNLVPIKLNNFDIYVALSRWHSESFGVAIVEAQACEIPVVVSNKGGLPEVVNHKITGYVVPSDNAEEAAKAITLLLEDEDLRKKMGQHGRERVVEHYDWQKNVDLMEEEYKKVLVEALK